MMRGLCFCIPGAPSGPPEIVIDSRGGEVLQVINHALFLSVGVSHDYVVELNIKMRAIIHHSRQAGVLN